MEYAPQAKAKTAAPAIANQLPQPVIITESATIMKLKLAALRIAEFQLCQPVRPQDLMILKQLLRAITANVRKDALLIQKGARADASARLAATAETAIAAAEKIPALARWTADRRTRPAIMTGSAKP